MEAVAVAIITSIIAPLVLFCIQQWKASKDTHIEEFRQSIIEVKRDLLRVQILDLVHHDPDNKAAILELYDIYKSAPYHGNSYIKDIIKEWQRKRNQQCSNG